MRLRSGTEYNLNTVSKTLKNIHFQVICIFMWWNFERLYFIAKRRRRRQWNPVYTTTFQYSSWFVYAWWEFVIFILTTHGLIHLFSQTHHWESFADTECEFGLSSCFSWNSWLVVSGLSGGCMYWWPTIRLIYPTI